MVSYKYNIRIENIVLNITKKYKKNICKYYFFFMNNFLSSNLN